MPPDYLWTDTAQINRYIQGRKVIMVGDTAGERGQGDINFGEGAAKEYENEAVNDITIQLSTMFSEPPNKASGGVPNPMLSRYAAKLTAAKIGAVYVGTSEGYVPNWILWYNNEVFASLFRLMLSVDYVVKSARPSPTAPLDTTLIPPVLDGLTFRSDYTGIGLADMLVLAKPRFTFIDRGSIQ